MVNEAEGLFAQGAAFVVGKPVAPLASPLALGVPINLFGGNSLFHSAPTYTETARLPSLLPCPHPPNHPS